MEDDSISEIHQKPDTASEGEGTFFVSHVLPIEAEEELHAETKESEVEGEEEAEYESDDELCTYQLEPSVTVKSSNIVAIAQRILEEYLQDKEYSSGMKDIAAQISSDIREEVKNMGLDRYRIICQVTVGEKCDQDVTMTFLCLWKHEFDHYAIATYDSPSIFSTAIVFVIYKQ